MQFEVLAKGYSFLEAPRGQGDCLWFTDLFLGGLRRRSPDGRIDTFLPDRKHIGGICLNHDGRLICGGPGGLIWFDPASGKSGEVLAAIPGERFTGANDFIPDGRGGLYFGTMSGGGDYEGPPMPCAIFHIDAERRVRKQDSLEKFANGMGLSPDGRTLYHNESLVGVFAYDVADDASLSGKRLFLARDDGDGLAVDEAGGVWIAHFASREITRTLPGGTPDRAIAIPHKVASSLCFAGSDRRDLYVTTGGDDGVDAMLRGEVPGLEAMLLHARSDVAGLEVPATRFTLPG